MNAVIEQDSKLALTPIDGGQRAMQTVPTGSSPAALIQYAMAQGADMDRLEKLFDLQVKWEANEARKAYVAAMADFKKSAPDIFKEKTVSFDTSSGTTTYKHATIGQVTSITIAALAAHGFSHRWETDQGDAGRITVTCIITHSLGHSEKVALSSSPDLSGGKNNIQAVASTVTYLQRYTLLSATGLATQDQADDDGTGSESKGDGEIALYWLSEIAKCKKGAEVNDARKKAGVALNAAGDLKGWNKVKESAITRIEALKLPPGDRNPPEVD